MDEINLHTKFYSGKDVHDLIIRHLSNDYHAALAAIRELSNIPAADVVEVVRCKDCRFCMAFKDKSDGFYGHCRRWIIRTISDYAALVYADGYCSYGERKEAQG